MTEQTSQIEGPFQADQFSLLKLAKRPKNARVMAISRSDTLLPNTPDLSSEGPYVLTALNGLKSLKLCAVVLNINTQCWWGPLRAIRGHLGAI